MPMTKSNDPTHTLSSHVAMYTYKAVVVLLCLTRMYYHSFSHVQNWLPLALFLVETQLRVFPWAETYETSEDKVRFMSRWFFAVNRLVCLTVATTLIVDDIVCINLMCFATVTVAVAWSVYELYLIYKISLEEYQTLHCILANDMTVVVHKDNAKNHGFSYEHMWGTMTKGDLSRDNYFVTLLVSFCNIKTNMALGVVSFLFMCIANRDYKGFFKFLWVCLTCFAKGNIMYNQVLENQIDGKWQIRSTPVVEKLEWIQRFYRVPLGITVAMLAYHMPVSIVVSILKNCSMPIAVCHYGFLKCMRYAMPLGQYFYRISPLQIMVVTLVVNTVFFRGLYIEQVDRVLESPFAYDSCATVQGQRYCYDGEPKMHLMLNDSYPVTGVEYAKLLQLNEHHAVTMETSNHVKFPVSMIYKSDWNKTLCEPPVSLEYIQNISRGKVYKPERRNILSVTQESWDDLKNSHIQIKNFLGVCRNKDNLNMNIKKVVDDAVLHALTNMKQYNSWVMYPQAIILESSYYLLGNTMWAFVDGYTGSVMAATAQMCDTVAQWV